MSNCPNIDIFFQGRKYNSDWYRYPIVLRWLKKAPMQSSMKIIDDKVGYLLSQPGGISKSKEWLLSDDQHLITTTAERYILDYLRILNPTMKDIFGGNDVDASILISGKEYGVEVTCILDTVAEWIIIERIQQYIEQNKINPTTGLTVKANLQTLQHFTYLTDTDRCDIINNLSSSIRLKGSFTYKGFSITTNSLHPGYISWEFEQDNSDPYNNLLSSLSNKLSNKSSQLNKRNDNILFISVGSMPTNWLFPDLFSEMKKPIRWKSEIDCLEKDVLEIINGTSVRGVCFFVYSLDEVNPLYPLKMITNDQSLVIKL